MFDVYRGAIAVPFACRASAELQSAVKRLFPGDLRMTDVEPKLELIQADRARRYARAVPGERGRPLRTALPSFEQHDGASVEDHWVRRPLRERQRRPSARCVRRALSRPAQRLGGVRDRAKPSAPSGGVAVGARQRVAQSRSDGRFGAGRDSRRAAAGLRALAAEGLFQPIRARRRSKPRSSLPAPRPVDPESSIAKTRSMD